MFISYSLTECPNCASVAGTMMLLNKKLSQLSDCVYNQEAYMLKCKADERLMKDLLYYKQMLSHLAYNRNFYSVNYNQIISKIKTLI
jgi:hypothetical protein